MKTFLKVMLVMLVMAGAAYGSIQWLAHQPKKAPAEKSGGKSGAPDTLKADALKVQTEPMTWNVTAIGTVTANETVELTSEQSRRLAAVHFEDGERVEKDRLLFELDRKDLEVKLDELKARMELATLNEARLKNLIELRATSQADYDTVRIEVAVLKAQIEQVQTDIDKTSIRAPFTGRIGLRQVSPGAWMTPTTVMARLQDDSKVKIDFKLPERYAPDVKLNATFRFRVESAPEWTDAVVTALEPQIEEATRSMLVRGLADNAGGHFYPGAFVQVEIPIVHREDAILIPAQAIMPLKGSTSVYTLEDGKATVRPVETGNRTADRIEITSGLAAGDVVLLSNLLRLKPGAKVDPQFATP